MERRKNQRRRRHKLQGICTGLAVISILMGLGLCSMEGTADSGRGSSSKEELRTPMQKAAQEAEIAAQKTKSADAGWKTTAGVSDWNLLLVNPWRKLPEGFSPELVRLKNGHAVDKRAYPALQRMMDDARSKGLSPIICSSYRSGEVQKSLYKEQIKAYIERGYEEKAARKEAGKWVAVPGTSEHQTGLALDIVAESYQLLNEDQAETPEQKWLMENAWNYGFILRYPKEKTKITGIGYEPWHYRYVGKKAAKEIYEKGICLEEYLD